MLTRGAFGGEQPASREALQQLFDTFRRLDFRIESLLTDGSQVSAEVSLRAEGADGQPYSNRYHNLFVIQDEKIQFFREYPSGVATSDD